MRKVACIILTKTVGDKLLILGVSRKDNHSDMNLIGGKMEDEDSNIEYTAIRETKEETGLDIFNLKLIDECIWGGYEQHCFIASYKGFINYDKIKENHRVEWVEPKVLTEGCFGEYTLRIFKELGIL